jgi:uncharacterized membrane protein YhhN
MSKRYRIIIFFIILVADLVAIQGEYKIAEYFFKPLIIIWLMAWFVLQLRYAQSILKKWIIFALFFSWLGDLLLMFHQEDSIFFLLGLSSFLIAHIFYILFFHFVRIKEMVKSRWYLLLIVAIYYAVIISLLSPYLGEMKLPVRIYAVVISFMFMLAMHMLFIKNKTTGLWMMAGAFLFVVSDSLLAINKFFQPFEMAGFFVISTYGLAQLFITEGAIRYISSEFKE